MRVDDFVNDLKRRLEEQRKEVGLRGCAKAIGISPSTLSRFLRGQNIDLNTFMQISRAIAALWGRKE